MLGIVQATQKARQPVDGAGLGGEPHTLFVINTDYQKMVFNFDSTNCFSYLAARHLQLIVADRLAYKLY